MNPDCTAAREWLLEAELSELRETSGPHASHIATCAECQKIRRALLHGHMQLEQGLDAIQPTTKSQRRRIPKAALWLPVPLAAAALLALMLQHHEPAPAPPSRLLTQLMLPEAPVVTPAAGKQAVVLEKRDLTVVWLY